jgi:hypothetical protein
VTTTDIIYAKHLPVIAQTKTAAPTNPILDVKVK